MSVVSDWVLSVVSGCVWSQQLVGTECLSVFQWNELLRFQEADLVFAGSAAQLGRRTQVGTVWAPSLQGKHTGE